MTDRAHETVQEPAAADPAPRSADAGGFRPGPLAPASILALQRAAGNAAVGRVLARDKVSPSPPVLWSQPSRDRPADELIAELDSALRTVPEDIASTGTWVHVVIAGGRMHVYDAARKPLGAFRLNPDARVPAAGYYLSTLDAKRPRWLTSRLAVGPGDADVWTPTRFDKGDLLLNDQVAPADRQALAKAVGPQPNRIGLLVSGAGAGHRKAERPPEEVRDVKETGFDGQTGKGEVALPEGFETTPGGVVPNAPAYPATIVSYGPGGASGREATVTGATGNFAMEIDYAAGSFGSTDETFNRMQAIAYRWELIDITSIRVDQLKATLKRRGADTDSGIARDLGRALANTREDTDADGQLVADNALLAPWLAVVAISDFVQVGGALISSYVSLVNQPLNERSIDFGGKGTYVLRCFAQPVVDETAKVVRAPSAAAMVVEVADINERATAAVDAEPASKRNAIEDVDAELERIRQWRDQDLRGVPLDKRDDGLREWKATLDLRGAELGSHQAKLEEARKRYAGFGTKGTKGRPVQPRMSLVSEETGQTYAIVANLAEATTSSERRRVWRLIDVASAATQDIYEGVGATHAAAIRDAFHRFRDDSGYGRGALAIRLPTDQLKAQTGEEVAVEPLVRVRPGSRARALKRLQDLATAAEVAGVFVGGGAGMAIGVAGGLAGGAVAGESLWRRRTAERLKLDAQTTFEVLGVIGAVVGLGGVAAKAARWTWVGDKLHIAGKGMLHGQWIVIPAATVHELARIDAEEREDERTNPHPNRTRYRARRLEAFANAVKSGLVQVMTYRATAPLPERPAAAADPDHSTRSVDEAAPQRRVVVDADVGGAAVEPPTASARAETQLLGVIRGLVKAGGTKGAQTTVEGVALSGIEAALTGDRLVVRCTHIVNTGRAGAGLMVLSACERAAVAAAKELGASTVEIGGMTIVNPRLLAYLGRRGYAIELVPTATGFEKVWTREIQVAAAEPRLPAPRQPEPTGQETKPRTARELEAADAYAGPPTLRSPGQGMKRPEAIREYFTRIQANPQVEHGLIQHIVTKEFHVLTGDVNGIAWPPEYTDRWAYVRHFHPNFIADPVTGRFVAAAADAKTSPFWLRFPSGEGGDLTLAQFDSLANRGTRPTSQTVDWFDPATKRMRTSRYGYIPNKNKPFWIEIVNESERTVKWEFATAEELNTAIRSHRQGASPGGRRRRDRREPSRQPDDRPLRKDRGESPERPMPRNSSTLDARHFTSRSDATVHYFREIEANPDREYGVLKHPTTNELAVITGTLDALKRPPVFKDWLFVRHYHANHVVDAATGIFGPIARDSKTGVFRTRFPSAGPTGDLAGAAKDYLKDVHPQVSETIDWFDPVTNRMRTSRFGYNAESKTPFWIEFVDERGASNKVRFSTLESAELWIELRILPEEAAPAEKGLTGATRVEERPPAPGPGPGGYRTAAEVHGAVIEALSKFTTSMDELPLDYQQAVDALAMSESPVNRKLEKLVPIVMRGLRSPELYGQVMAEAWERSIAHGIDTNAALVQMGKESGLPVKVIKARQGQLDPEVFFDEHVTKPARIVDKGVGDEHGIYTHLLQELVVDRALRAAGRSETSSEFRQLLGRAEGTYAGALRVGDLIWSVTYDLAEVSGHINQPESLREALRPFGLR